MEKFDKAQQKLKTAAAKSGGGPSLASTGGAKKANSFAALKDSDSEDE